MMFRIVGSSEATARIGKPLSGVNRLKLAWKILRARQVSLSDERVHENFRTFSVGRLVGHAEGSAQASLRFHRRRLTQCTTKPVRRTVRLQERPATVHTRLRRVRTVISGQAAF
jgi:hypothetical protein